MAEGRAFCTGCGKPRDIIAPTVDPRYPLVACGKAKRPGVFDPAIARQIIKERRTRRKVRREVIEATYSGMSPTERARATRPIS